MVGNGAPQPGDVLGNYVLKRLLGTGGMGLVYLAEHERLHRKVALKLLRPELTQDPVSVRRFFAEARAVNEIGHDNIVEVTDFVDQGEHRYFVMELLKGHSLGDVLMQGRLPLARTMHIARQIADALAAAHEAGVVHRDLKPQNVFLIKRGMDADFVKVLDFGIAKVRGMEGDVEQTAAGTFVGTPAYMAPEQLANKPCDHRVDVYSFGVVFFELVTGLRPFRATNMAEIIVQQLTMPPPKPSMVLKENGGTSPVPDKLERFLLALLEKNPDKRVQSMRDVLNVIEEIVPLVAGTSAGVGSMPPRGGLVDTSGEYALPSAGGGWVSVNKDNAALTTGEGFIPGEEPEFANLDDVIDASGDAVPAPPPLAAPSNASPSAAPKAAAPISFAPLPPLPPFPPLPTLPPLGRAPTPFGASPSSPPSTPSTPSTPPAFGASASLGTATAAPSALGASGALGANPFGGGTPSSPLDDASKPILVGRPIADGGPMGETNALPSNGDHSGSNGNGNSGSDYANTTLGADGTLGGNTLDGDSTLGGNTLDGVVPALVPRAETSPTMAHLNANLSPDLLDSEGAPPRSKRGLAIAAAAAIAVVVLVAVVMSGGDDDETPNTDGPVVAPTEPPVVVATDPPPTPTPTPPTPATPNTDPTGSDTPPEVPPIAVTPEDLNEPVSNDPVPATSSRKGRSSVEVSFTSKPAGATVVVGGKTLGVTPLKAKVPESRSASVSFKLEGHEPKTVSASLRDGATVAAALVEVKKEEPKGNVKDGALINPFKKKPK